MIRSVSEVSFLVLNVFASVTLEVNEFESRKPELMAVELRVSFRPLILEPCL